MQEKNNLYLTNDKREYTISKKGEDMRKPKKHLSKKIYIYLAFVTMAAVSLFAKPIKRGLHSLNNRLKNASHKQSLRAHLGLAQQNFEEPILPLKRKRSR